MPSVSTSERAADAVPTVAEKLAEWERHRDLRGTHRVAVYVSAPISTGRTFIEWFRREGRNLPTESGEYGTALRANVILPNMQRAAAFIELLRWRPNPADLVIDPRSLDVPGWDQTRYHDLWTKVIERHVRRVIFLDGWEYSHGCMLEFEIAQRLFLDSVDERFQPLVREQGLSLMAAALDERRKLGIDTSLLRPIVDRVQSFGPSAEITGERRLYKDEILDRMASTANVAQFVSFAPGPQLDQRYCRIRGHLPNHRFATPLDAVRALLSQSPEGLVNIRTFNPSRPEGNPLDKFLRQADHVMEYLHLRGNKEGLHTIVNETINEGDGGVSGVAYRGVIEFAPDANPRCVDDEEVETTALPLELGMRFLRCVYGFEPDLRGRDGARVEFSIHPAPRGWMHDHTVIWQVEQKPARELKPTIRWPNRFSRLLGDKAFGLALAASASLPVPWSLVFTRRVLPFGFGRSTGTFRYWTRTCPPEKTPGLYPSARGWFDPMKVLEDWRSLDDGRVRESGDDSAALPPVASVLIQEAVRAVYSGRAVARSHSRFAIAGVRGEGDAFMLGDAPADDLPKEVVQAVRESCRHAVDALGLVSLEWVFDGFQAWIVQVNRHPELDRETRPIDGIEWVEFRHQNGCLKAFHDFARDLAGSAKGITVIGNVSPLSHISEIAESYRVPVRFTRPSD